MKKMPSTIAVQCWLLLTFALCLAAPLRAQEVGARVRAVPRQGGARTLQLPLNINEMVNAKKATVTGSKADIGNYAALFDGNTETLCRSANVNPQVIQVSFSSAQTVRAFRVFGTNGGKPSPRWKVEAANKPEDLEARAGTYVEAVPWTDAHDSQDSVVKLDAPVTASLFRLTVQRLHGDNYVHTREWTLSGDVTFDAEPLLAEPLLTESLFKHQRKQFRADTVDVDGIPYHLLGKAAWSSSDPSVATVDGDGLVTAVGVGRCRIVAALEQLALTKSLQVGLAEPRDLDATYIERTPRYDYDAAKGNPTIGEDVTFHGHIKNWGPPTPSVKYLWHIDGKPVAEGTVNLAAYEDHVVTLPWKWQDGDHRVALIVDPEDIISEASEENNQREDHTNALSVGFWVEQTLYDYFHKHQQNLGIGSNSWEDWAQRQIAKWNELARESIWPSSPQGLLDRLRLDKIVLVPDNALPLAGGLPSNTPDRRDKTVDLMWGFGIDLIKSNYYADTVLKHRGHWEPWNAFYYEGSVLHELAHARYLGHNSEFRVEKAAVHILENGQPVAGSQAMPTIDNLVYANQDGSVMYGPFMPTYPNYDNPWSPYEVGALNRVAGRRADQSNMNEPHPRHLQYLNDLPESNHVRLVDAGGKPLQGAEVSVYQSRGVSDRTIDNVPDLQLTTDKEGYAHLPRNPFAQSRTVNENTGTIVLRIAHGGKVWYRFMEVSAFNLEFWRGRAQDAYYTIELPDPSSGSQITVWGRDRPLANRSSKPSLENHTDFGSVVATEHPTLHSPKSRRVFLVKNRGAAVLQLSGDPRVQITGPEASDFMVLSQPDRQVGPGCLTTFHVWFQPKGTGVRTATLTIKSNDAQAPSFSFAIQGTGVAPAPAPGAVFGGQVLRTRVGDIGMYSTISQVDVGEQSVMLDVSASALADGKVTSLPAIKSQRVRVDEQTSIHLVGHPYHRLSLADVKKGTAAAVIIKGTPRQVGEPDAVAREIVINGLWLDTLDLSAMTCGSQRPVARLSLDGTPLRLGGRTYTRGVGTHAPSDFALDLAGGASRFTASVGIDDKVDAANKGSVVFEVWVDNKRVAQSPPMQRGMAPHHFDVDLQGAKLLGLRVTDGGNGKEHDYANWCSASIHLSRDASAKPKAVNLSR